ncbi:hypothetical protein M406DRAFT_66545 [Cryphonectria parasitica EP155]|uniref:Uncharacterized protein n=1 Tax=Cryphonectria parasitica (strain ATCC 38755 / EP155) TaxID=660469 RepID=A0A9P5CUJ4_CRYP1|nr:uncharacterized protein M406DRAFT_66545 [Cryphonectria parasitica EP155]KAF3770105.1 hypothetical protein M406DRAFT_66545 [Cryphonectria parasitica EP155]
MAFNGGRGDLEAARQFHQQVQRGELRDDRQRRGSARGGRGSRGGGNSGSRGLLDTPSNFPRTNSTPTRGGRGGRGGPGDISSNWSERLATAPPNHYFQNVNVAAAQANQPATDGDAGDPMIVDDVPASPKRGLSASPWAAAPDCKSNSAGTPGPIAHNAIPATTIPRGIDSFAPTAAAKQQATISTAQRSVGTATLGGGNGLGGSRWADKPFNPVFGVDTGAYVDKDWMYTYTIEDGGRLFDQAAENACAAGDRESEAKLRQVVKLCTGVVHARVHLQDQNAELQARTAANKAAKQACKDFEKYKPVSRNDSNNKPKLAEASGSVHISPQFAAQVGPHAVKPTVPATAHVSMPAQGAQTGEYSRSAAAQAQSSQQQNRHVQQSAQGAQGIHNNATRPTSGPATQNDNAQSQQLAAEQWIRETFFNKNKQK